MENILSKIATAYYGKGGLIIKVLGHLQMQMARVVKRLKPPREKIDFLYELAIYLASL